MISEFGKEQQEDALALAGLRNEEIHGSESPLSSETFQWMPKFTRIVDVLCTHLGLDASALVGERTMEHGRALADEADQRLLALINKRIKAAEEFLGHLKPEEIAARQAAMPLPPPGGDFFVQRRVVLDPISKEFMISEAGLFVDCPACARKVILQMRAVRQTNSRIEEDDVIAWDVVYVGTSFKCGLCDLELENTAEIRAAGIEVQYVEEMGEDISTRYAEAFEGPDYGND
ncbi:hypothetical protein [Actinomadura sp. NPDC000929]|uniref:hypothetical protein n=1 Tax=Actinomadura sp. NPDC000929 TaxID=3154517 RepID=UPI003395C2AC